MAWAIVTALAAMFVAPVGSQTPVDPTKLGPQVGEKTQPFALPDQTGAVRQSSGLAGPNGTMLVFFRSSDW